MPGTTHYVGHQAPTPEPHGQCGLSLFLAMTPTTHGPRAPCASAGQATSPTGMETGNRSWEMEGVQQQQE